MSKKNTALEKVAQKVINNMKAEFPAYGWSSWGTWTLNRDILGDDTVINV